MTLKQWSENVKNLQSTMGSAWLWNDDRQQYFYHAFTPAQPDLDFRNPAVVNAIKGVMQFWLDQGISGFRVDAVPYLLECKDLSINEEPLPGTDGSNWNTLNHTCTMNRPENHQVLNMFAELVYNYSLVDETDRCLLLEAVIPTSNILASYYGEGKYNFMNPFNFDLLILTDQETRALFFKQLIDFCLDTIPAGGIPIWVVGSHDRIRMANLYGAEMVDAMNVFLHFLPGAMVTYYGEEIGMQDTYIRSDQMQDPQTVIPKRDTLRTPMQWDNTTSAGFSSNWTTWLPVNPNYYWLNVAAQQASPTSHLKVFQEAAQLKKDLVLQRGDLRLLAPDNDTLVTIRSYNGSSFILLINMASEGKVFTSQNLFSRYDLDMDLSVSLVSVNCPYQVGYSMKKGDISITLRPKAAIVLRSSSASSISSSSLMKPSSFIVMLCFVLNCIKGFKYLQI